jgi:histidine triad (HIT) family protein
MPSIFSKIVAGHIPAFKIAQDELFLAFLDVNPLQIGHTLVIPKKEIDYIFDLDDEIYSGLMLFSKKVAHAIEKSVDCKKVSVHVIGLEVPHAHVHLIPINQPKDCNFSEEKLKLSKETFEETARKIIENFS